MHDFELSLEEGKPANLFAFAVDLQATPPKISGNALDIQKYIPLNNLVKSVPFKDAVLTEGILNIFTCRFEKGKCSIYFFGNLKGSFSKSKMDYKIQTLRDFDLLNEKIEFILSKSKNILKSYYNQGKIKNIEHHLFAFLTDNQAL